MMLEYRLNYSWFRAQAVAYLPTIILLLWVNLMGSKLRLVGMFVPVGDVAWLPFRG